MGIGAGSVNSALPSLRGSLPSLRGSLGSLRGSLKSVRDRFGEAPVLPNAPVMPDGMLKRKTVETEDPRLVGGIIGDPNDNGEIPQGARRDANSNEPFRESSMTRIVIKPVKDKDGNLTGKSEVWAFNRERSITGGGRVFGMSEERKTFAGVIESGKEYVCGNDSNIVFSDHEGPDGKPDGKTAIDVYYV